MSKIVQAVNAMISNKQLIKDVLLGDREVFFRYRNKYKWSIRQTEDGEYILWHYPGGGDLEELAAYIDDDWEGVPMVSYKTSEIGTKEAEASFAELYQIVKERAYGMDEILDDIISDLDPF